MRLSIDQLSFSNANDENPAAIGVKIPLEGDEAELMRRQYNGETSWDDVPAIDKIVTSKVREAMAEHNIFVNDEESQVFDACEGCFSVMATGESGEGDGFIIVNAEEVNQ